MVSTNAVCDGSTQDARGRTEDGHLTLPQVGVGEGGMVGGGCDEGGSLGKRHLEEGVGNAAWGGGKLY